MTEKGYKLKSVEGRSIGPWLGAEAKLCSFSSCGVITAGLPPSPDV